MEESSMAKILAVDDSKAIRTMMKIVLESEGHKVALMEDGVEAMKFARERTADLVISDLNMPNMGGMSLATNLRRLENYKNVPILIMTTESADYKKQKAKNSGANGWIQKPVEQEKLIRAVNKVLKIES